MDKTMINQEPYSLTTTLYASFNARNLSPEQVASSFVRNNEFDSLLALNSTILMGPRGCGKTTMFKMLTLPALTHWRSINAKKSIREVQFYAVYIPTDIHWNIQALYLKMELESFPIFYERISRAFVTTNIFSSLCQTMIDIIQFEKRFNEAAEVELCKRLIKEWLLPATIPSLKDILIALSSRISQINQYVTQIRDSYHLERISSEKDLNLPKDSFFYLDYFSSLKVACLEFENRFRTKKSWALCFDELELAPKWLEDDLYLKLRSSDQRFIFKISAAPLIRATFTKAQPGHDVKVIRMWPHKTKNYYAFSEQIVKNILKKNSIHRKPEDLVGHSIVYSSNIGNIDNEYSHGSITWEKIKELASFDDSLRTLLLHHQIDPEDPIAHNPTQLDTVLRKIKQTVFFRLEYNRKNKDFGRPRSRKIKPFFNGIEVLFNICEGNPRWLIGITNDLLNSIKNLNNPEQIDENIQSRIFEEAAKRFFAFTTASPEASQKIGEKYIYLKNVLNTLGTKLFNHIILEEFHLDPKGSFIVDTKDESTLNLLKYALFLGAIILLDPSDDIFDTELNGKRIRLSYLLCPLYKIPLRTYLPVSLTKWLRTGKNIFQQEQINFLP
jgi:hypothetical protein